MSEKKNEKNEIVKYDKNALASLAGVGISNLNPEDIMAPQILLVQALSKKDEMTDKGGEQAKPGEYYHTGSSERMEEFQAYILSIKKGTYIDRRKPEEGKKIMIILIGCLERDFSLFAMRLRGSSLSAVNKLLTTSTYEKRPIWSYLVKFEKKYLSGEKGDWYIPVIRTEGQEADETMLRTLEGLSRKFDVRRETEQVTDDTTDIPL